MSRPALDISGAARSLRQLREGVARAHSLEAIFQIALTCLRDVLGVERAAVLLFDAAGVMRFVASAGLSDVYRQRVEGHSPWSRDQANASPIWVNDVSREPSLLVFGDVFEREGIGAVGFVPLRFGDKLFGKFMLYHQSTHDFSREEADLAESVADHIAFAIEHHQIQADLVERLESGERARRAVENEVAMRVAIEGSMRAGVAAFDEDGTQWYCSAAFCEMLGYARTELVGKNPPFVYWPAEEVEPMRAAFARAADGDVKTDGLELRFEKKGGERFDVLVSVSRLELGGAHRGWLWTVQDISASKRREARLSEHEKRLRLALAAGRMGAWDFDIATGRLTWSPELEAIHGIPSGSFDGTYQGFARDIHEADKARVLGAVAQALDAGHDYAVEYRIVLPDGRTRWIAAQGTVIRDAEARAIRLLGVCGDISDRKRLERGRDLLGEASRVLSMQLDQGAALSGLVRLAVPELADSCVVYLRADDGSISPVVVEPVASCAGEPVAARLAARRGEVPAAVSRMLETARSRPASGLDGLGPVAAWPESSELGGSSLLVPLCAGGRVVGCVSFSCRGPLRQLGPEDTAIAEELVRRAGIAVHNAGLLREAEAARAATEQARERAQMLAEASDVLAASLDPDTTLRQLALFVVPRVADYAVTYACEGKAIRRLGLTHRQPEKVALLEALLLGGEPKLGDRFGPGAVIGNGEPILSSEISDELLVACIQNTAHLEAVRALAPRSSMVVPLKTRGRIIGAITFAATDDSGRTYTQGDLGFVLELANRVALLVDNARLYREARDAIRAREDILAVVSHDLRSPLSTISTAWGLLEQNPGAEARRKAQLNIGRAAKQMDRLIQDLLDVSRVDAGGLAVTLAPVDLASLIDEAYALMLPLAEDKSVKLERAVGAEIGLIQGDRHRLLQMLANLLGNALKFVSVGGQVTIGAQELYGQIRLWISDDGPGISPDHLPKVFDRFWQANRHGSHGAGLGLAIAKSVIEAHGGEIGVHSKLGEGSTFFCWLSSAAARRGGAAALAPSRPEPPGP